MSNCKAVVLAGDGNGLVLQVNNGLIGAAVAVTHFVGLQTRCQAHQLMTQTDAHYRETICNRLCQGIAGRGRFAGVGRVTWPVAAEKGVNGVLFPECLVADIGWTPNHFKDHAELS